MKLLDRFRKPKTDAPKKSIMFWIWVAELAWTAWKTLKAWRSK
jgi:hypothetical protein